MPFHMKNLILGAMGVAQRRDRIEFGGLKEEDGTVDLVGFDLRAWKYPDLIEYCPEFEWI